MTELERVRAALDGAGEGYSEVVQGRAIVVTIPAAIEGRGDPVEAIEAGKLGEGGPTRLRFNKDGKLEQGAT